MRLIFSIFLTLSSVCYLLAQQPYSNDYKLSTDTLLSERIKEEKKPWSSPQKATIFALALPGSGQIFNKKYLKAGIVYGGFVGLSYMFDFNRDSLSKYQVVYAAKIDGDSNTVDLFPNISEASVRSNRDFHRKYRDLSLIGFVVLYALQAIDANVDAHLKEFNLNEDLSLKLIPRIYANRPGLGMYNGFSLQYNF
ncbi:MAG: DUF5683 domain-containing protein [Bacteroidia bacterium]|nr:DUF5683 domain-containing protein [Bacteroidia bacterium]